MYRKPDLPFFSVVVAAYNSGERILPTIRSVLAQAYRQFEVLVIGDGCSDATGAILAANFGEAVVWANLPRNHGCQSYPNNAGIGLSRGTHVAYLGHDDIWSPHHLEKLAAIIQAADPDFAVSGAVYHTPPGSKYYQFTGIFDDPSTAKREFFPPSSLAHRREVVQRIGPWRDPHEVNAPVDCEFLLRAAAYGCRFVSTKVITVHKFAAGHRYLWYRFPSAHEQQRMLDRLLRAGGEAEVLREIEAELADGAQAPPIRYFDFGKLAPGQLYREARQSKGLDRPPLLDVDRRIEDRPHLRLPQRSTGIRSNSTPSTARVVGPAPTRIRSICFRCESSVRSTFVSVCWPSRMRVLSGRCGSTSTTSLRRSRWKPSTTGPMC